MIIALVDTSIFCEILRIPGKSQQPDAVLDQLQAYINDGVTLLLPMATIIETGNHIAQNGNGNIRRQKATDFVRLVQQAIDGQAPWSLTRPPFDPETLRTYLNEFPNHAMQGTGMGDLTIIKEFEFQCELHPYGRIFIWSLDEHLRGYHQGNARR